MNLVTAFAAVGLTAVSWDGTLSRAGARSLRHALDYREPFCRMSDNAMVLLMDAVLALRRERGNKALMLQAAAVLSPAQALTAYAMASELMRSDGPYSGRGTPSSGCSGVDAVDCATGSGADRCCV